MIFSPAKSLHHRSTPRFIERKIDGLRLSTSPDKPSHLNLTCPVASTTNALNSFIEKYLCSIQALPLAPVPLGDDANSGGLSARLSGSGSVSDSQGVIRVGLNLLVTLSR